MVTGHQCMIQIKEQVKIKNNSLSDITLKKNNLSIQLSMDGFSFCIKDSSDNSVLFLQEYSFEDYTKTPGNMLEAVEIVFDMSPELQYGFESLNVTHYNNLTSIVPNTFFDSEKLGAYLDKNIKLLKNDYITHDDLEQIPAKTVYIPFVNINNFLFERFGDFEYKHTSSVLVDSLLKHSKTSQSEPVLYINVCKSSFEIVYIKDNNLQFFNTFIYNSKEDFMYYILFVGKQLSLDFSEVKVLLLGLIERHSSIYKISERYIKNMSFLESSESMFETKAGRKLSKHSFYTLLNQ